MVTIGPLADDPARRYRKLRRSAQFRSSVLQRQPLSSWTRGRCRLLAYGISHLDAPSPPARQVERPLAGRTGTRATGPAELGAALGYPALILDPEGRSCRGADLGVTRATQPLATTRRRRRTRLPA